MRRTPRFLVVALPVVLVAAACWLHQASSRLISTRRPTIEPSLPLMLDLHARAADPGRGEPPHLEAIVDASEDLDVVSLLLVLPEGVRAESGSLSGGGAGALRAGERRTFVVPLQARRPGVFPIRLEASFRLPDGRVFHTQQGFAWRSGVGVHEGRHHAGAYEWMAVPVEEPLP